MCHSKKESNQKKPNETRLFSVARTPTEGAVLSTIISAQMSRQCR